MRPRGYFWKVRQAVSVHFSVLWVGEAKGLNPEPKTEKWGLLTCNSPSGGWIFPLEIQQLHVKESQGP